MDKSCVGVNWHEMGRQDSTRGLPFEEAFSDRQEICSLDPESVWTKAYKNGFRMASESIAILKPAIFTDFHSWKKQRKAVLNPLRNCLRMAFAWEITCQKFSS